MIHDDVMDGSDTRRGAPSIHRSLEALHEDSQWRGSAENFWPAGAILLGDLCLSWSDQLLFESGLPAVALIRTKPIFDVTRTELMAGQYLDVVEQARADIDSDRALLVARYKSAKYTVERLLPLISAQVPAGAPPNLIATLSAYGLPLEKRSNCATTSLASSEIRRRRESLLVTISGRQADPPLPPRSSERPQPSGEQLNAGLGDPDHGG